jgi:transcriptional regulator with XRE-family HTH domain
VEETESITATVCARADVQDALRRGEWAIALRAFLDAGLSQMAIAARTGISQSQISRLAAGKSRDPGMKTVKALCDGLAIPRRMAGLLDETEGADTTDRREFLMGSLGLVTAAVVPQSELGDERLLMATSLSYRQLEQRTPSKSLVQPVTAHLALTADLARRASGKQQQRLSAAVSEVAGLAAWLHADLVEPAKVRRFYQTSIRAAQQSGHGLLAVYMQGSYGQYATDVGDALHGLRLLQDAEARLGRSAPPTARAWLAALTGVALGHLGDKSALRMLDAAERHAEAAQDADPVWPWVFAFDLQKIASYRAITAARLSVPKVAEGAFSQANGLVRSPKQAAVTAVERARALAAAGDVDAACELATKALTVGRSYESERVCYAVRDFRASVRSVPRRITEPLDEALHAPYQAGIR